MKPAGQSQTVDPFALLYTQSDDPWHIDRSWYEHRKRALLMACLPRERFDVILEPGCGTGTLSELLAMRCRLLIACDIAPRAIELARVRLETVSNVDLSCRHIPNDWPEGADSSTVDCVVISELAYYLAPPALAQLLARIRNCLKPDGMIVACHWKGPFAERTAATQELHTTIASATAMQSIVHHDESDFLLDVWTRDAYSIAAQEGLA